MASKDVALATLTNTGEKRKAENANCDVMKKLKSHDRTMSMEDAEKQLAGSDAKIKAKNKIILDRQREMRELQEKLKTADRSLTMAKNAVAKIKKEDAVAEQMKKSDADLIIAKITANNLSSYCAQDVGRDAMDDIISLGNDDDILRLVCGVVDKTSSKQLFEGAIRSAMAAYDQQPSSTLVKAIRMLYQKLLAHKEIYTDYKIWPLIASAMNIGVCEIQNAGLCVESQYYLLSKSLPEMAEQMKKTNPLEYGRYCASKDSCPIIDLLAPTFDAILHEGGSAAKAKLFELMKKSLLESVNEIETTPSYAMPTEAAIAGKRGFPEVQRFLLSPTETSLQLDLYKAGRMAVHRLIDNSMGYNKLEHSSEGYGRSRFLVVRKVNAEPSEMLKKRKERKEKHSEMLVKFNVFHACDITLPPPNTKLGLTLADASASSWNMPKLKGVAPNSPILDQIPAQFRQDVCIASLKSEAIGFVQPRTLQECVMAIGKSLAWHGPVAQRKLEIVLVPLK